MKPFVASTVILALLPALLGPAPSSASDLDLARLWPNADGNSWTYRQIYQDRTAPVAEESTVRMFFDGEITLPDGSVVQNLRGEAVDNPFRTGTPGSAFWRQLLLARPDLRDAVMHKMTFESPGPFLGLLLAPLPFEKTASEIHARRDNLSPSIVSWIWLVANLAVGTEFQLRLIPELADDVFLFGTVAAVEDIAVPAGLYADAVRVDYRIDFGTSQCTDEFGSNMGQMHGETIGSIHFAADTGPVRSVEEFAVVSSSGACPAPGVVSTSSLELLQTGTVAVEQSTWGTVKQLFGSVPWHSGHRRSQPQ